MVGVSRRQIEEASIQHLGQTVRLGSTETTMHIGVGAHRLAWAYRRPRYVSVSRGGQEVAIPDHAFRIRLMLAIGVVAGYVWRKFT